MSGNNGLSFLFNDIHDSFNGSRSQLRRRPKSYIMATSSSSPLSASDDSVVSRNVSSDVK
uniref:Uncharacterized protein n=1 Tax=Setaria digitata TaxID=48799 RepID=A0A915PU58_9BILA